MSGRLGFRSALVNEGCQGGVGAEDFLKQIAYPIIAFVLRVGWRIAVIPAHQPVVVIAVPVYNGGLFLREALEDLRRQTFQDFRVVNVDDGSTDNSDEIIKEYLDDPRFHYERLPAHRGKIGAMPGQRTLL